VLLLVSKMEPYDDNRAKLVRADGKIEKPFSDDPGAVMAMVKQHLDKVLAARPAPAAAPIDEFAAAVPAEGEAAAAAPAPEPEPEMFSTRPAPVRFESEAPMGFTGILSEEAPAEPAPTESGLLSSPAEPPAASVSESSPSEAVMDLSQATMLTSTDELQRRIAEESPEGTPVAPAVFEEPVAEAEIVMTTRQHRAPEAAPPPPPVDEGTVIMTRLDKPAGAQTREVEKPVLAEAWEMTGPQPGAPPVPVVGGFDSQWSGTAAEEAPAEAAPVEESPAPAEQPYAADEFAAAMSAALADQPPTPPEPEPEEPAVATPAPMADAYVAPAMMPGVDPSLVDEVVNRVLERLTPQVMDTIAREVVRPLAESLLREKLRQ
jgi:hypothetical protein